MIVEKNPDLSEAAESLYTMNADDLVRAKCRAREDYYRYQGAVQAKIKQLTEEKAQMAAEKEQMAAENAQLVAEKTQMAVEKAQAAARAEQATARAELFSSEAEFLRKLLSEKGISIPENMKKL
jgi:phage terminase Nu1 subunit (DNA packaging protein)